MIHIYYHFDADGYAAAAIIASMYLTSNDKAEKGLGIFTFKDEWVKFHSCRHDFPMDLTSFNPERDSMYIVDYSFSRDDDQEMLSEMLKNYPNMKFVWIDHHKTSEIIIANNPIFEEVLKRDGYVVCPEPRTDGTHLNYSGAMLAYFYVINRLHMVYNNKTPDVIGVPEFISHDEEYLENLYKRSPDWIRLVSDHDTWRHEIPLSSEFVKGATEKGLWNTFLNMADDNSFMNMFYMTIVKPIISKDHFRNNVFEMILKNKTTQLCESGLNIFKWEDNRNGRLIRSNAFESRLHIDIPVEYIDPKNNLHLETTEDGRVVRDALLLCYNGHGNSRTFLDNIEKYDAVVIFSFNGENFTYSMFSKKDGFQCNIAALYFGKLYGITGGGHYHAAGWTADEITFRKNKIYWASEDSYFEDFEKEGNEAWPELWRQKSDGNGLKDPS